MIDYHKIPSPCYVLEESLLRRNLELISTVKEEAGVEIILALKAFAMWKAFPIIKEYIAFATASSVSEARLVYEEMGTPAYTYAPVYGESDFRELITQSSHITFNSLAQFERLSPLAHATEKPLSFGLRINPEYSVVPTDLYNPCSPGSRLGVTREQLPDRLPAGIEGLHFHTLCESSSYDLEKTLQHVEARFGDLFSQIRWINMGGGHLMTRKDYDTTHLISLLKSFKARYPHLTVILEPGSAFTWQTGFLRTTVMDLVENGGITTAIMDASFTCHMPDCLEMPYRPTIRGAMEETAGLPTYRIGGASCLSGDFIGNWSFPSPLKVGDPLIFEDMIHYTVVKTTMFNGLSHPNIACLGLEGQLIPYRTFTYDDYKRRMC